MRGKKSNTKLKKQSKKKTNPSLIETISRARKNNGWKKIAEILSGGTRRYSALNLFEIDKKTEIGDTIVIPGKVLSKGGLSKKIRICALSFSEKAREKIKKSKSEAVYLIDEINKNNKAEGIKVLR